MSLFSSIGDFFSNTFGGQSVYNEPSMGGVTLPTKKPSVIQQEVVSQPTNGGGSIFNGIGSMFESIGGAVKSGVETFYGAKSQYEKLKTAQQLENIKLKAVTASAQNAPAPAQIVLPTFSDWLNNPSEAASKVTPAAIAGSGALQTGSSVLTLALVGGAIFLLAKR